MFGLPGHEKTDFYSLWNRKSLNGLEQKAKVCGRTYLFFLVVWLTVCSDREHWQTILYTVAQWATSLLHAHLASSAVWSWVWNMLCNKVAYSLCGFSFCHLLLFWCIVLTYNSRGGGMRICASDGAGVATVKQEVQCAQCLDGSRLLQGKWLRKRSGDRSVRQLRIAIRP